MFEFNNNMGEPIKQNFDKEILNCVIEFMYTGKTKIDSSHLIDLLDFSHQYLLPKLKMVIEFILIGNLSIESFLDTYTVYKAFECNQIHKSLVKFGIENVKQLKQNQILGKLDTVDQRLILQK